MRRDCAVSAAVVNPDVRTAEYSGIDRNMPLDDAVGATGSSAMTTSGFLSTINSDDLLVASNFTQRSITASGPGYTTRLIDRYGQILEDKEVSISGAYNATAPQESYDWYVMQLAAFRAAVISSPSPPPSSPYVMSSILGGISWDESSKQRYAIGSDIWDSTWASDGLVYGAWGDGNGFAGVAKSQIGITNLTGSPATPPDNWHRRLFRIAGPANGWRDPTTTGWRGSIMSVIYSGRTSTALHPLRFSNMDQPRRAG